MKKTFLLFASALIAFSSFAGGNEAQKTNKKGEGVLSNGFYLNLGVAFPSSLATPSKFEGSSASNYPAYSGSYSYSRGIEPNLEIGNQWYFWHNDRFGIGLKVSWLQFGYSGYSTTNDATYNSTSSTIRNSQFGNFNVRLLKLAPQFSVAVNSDLAFDLYYELAPTANIGGGVNQYTVPGQANGFDVTKVNIGYGLLMAPGLRVRYKVFAVGFDYGFGTLNTSVANSYSSGYPSSLTFKPSTADVTEIISNPRVYLGFQF